MHNSCSTLADHSTLQILDSSYCESFLHNFPSFANQQQTLDLYLSLIYKGKYLLNSNRNYEFTVQIEIYWINILTEILTRMSHWKTLINTSDPISRNHSPHNRSKYSPARKFNSSFSSKGRPPLSKIASPNNCNTPKERLTNSNHGQLENCMSEAALKNGWRTGDKFFGKRTGKESKSQVQAIKQVNLSGLQASFYLTGKESHIFQQQQIEIEKIKREFKLFQKTILKQLQRQEEIIDAIMGEIMEQMKDKVKENCSPNVSNQLIIEPQKKYNPIFCEEKLTKLQKQFTVKKIDSFSSENSGLIPENSEPESSAPLNTKPTAAYTKEPEQKSSLLYGQGKQKHSFSRFFEAMNLLKKQMRDLSSMSSPYPRNKHIDYSLQIGACKRQRN